MAHRRLPATQPGSRVKIEPQGVDAVVLAGGVNKIELYQGYKPGYKALIPFAGKPSIRYVLEALRGSRYIRDICVVGEEAELRKAVGDIPVSFVEPGDGLLGSIINGLEFFRESNLVLGTSADIPLVTASSLDAFLEACGRTPTTFPGNFWLAATQADDFTGVYAEVSKPLSRFKDITVCHGNAWLVQPSVLDNVVARQRLDAMYAARKSQIKSALALGLEVGITYVLGVHIFHFLTLSQMTKIASRRFNLGVLPVLGALPELCLDVDEGLDYVLVKRILEERAATQPKAKAVRGPRKAPGKQTKSRATAPRRKTLRVKPLEVGVFTSSLAIADPLEALRAARDLGIRIVQIGPLPPEWYEESGVSKLKAELEGTGTVATAACAAFPGEDYSDIQAVIDTVGYLPAATMEERLEITRKVADLAAAVGAPFVTTHIGFMPHDRRRKEYKRLLGAVRQIADYCREKGLSFVMETGQETAKELDAFIRATVRDNVKVNFDPANMIMYGTGEPLPALDIVGKYVVHVHVKDGVWPEAKGQLGHEEPLGQGQVDIPAFVAKLKQIGYKGPLVIEREAGEDRVGDIRRGKALLDALRQTPRGR